MSIEKCFSCNHSLTAQVKYAVQTRDGQRVFVGGDCYKRIAESLRDGYQSTLGGPRLFLEVAEMRRLLKKEKANG
jgi:hypothetical protein